MTTPTNSAEWTVETVRDLFLLRGCSFTNTASAHNHIVAEKDAEIAEAVRDRSSALMRIKELGKELASLRQQLDEMYDAADQNLKALVIQRDEARQQLEKEILESVRLATDNLRLFNRRTELESQLEQDISRSSNALNGYFLAVR